MRPNKNALIENIKELYGFCREQNVKVKLELYSDRPGEVAKSVHIKNPDVDINGVKFSINELVTSYRLVIYRLNSFLKCMEDFHIYKDLEVLDILLHHFEISDDDKNTCMSNLGRYSFKNCKKLKKKVTLFYLNCKINDCECPE
uniref:PRESAN domain-containing protein n=1 Tax=Strongyloides papillosus TaxID=174720 RepID=A0A0N5BNZ1_STREA